MRNFEYVPKEEYGPVKEKLIGLIKNVQYELRDYFTFQFTFIGSSSRNMITREIDGNRGYDFDVDIRVNNAEDYTPAELKHLLMKAFNLFVHKYGYGFCEDSTRVLTIKTVDIWNPRICFSCDFAIVREVEGKDGKTHHLYVFNDKGNNEYCWHERSREYNGLKEKEEKIKQAGLWSDVRDIYLEKKCSYSDEKKSRTLFAETINEVFDSL